MLVELKEKCGLSFYKEIGVLNDQKNILLVQNQLTNKIYVQKRMEIYDKEVYANIKDHPHKNISKVYEYFQMDDQLFVIEEFINGCTLEDMLTEEGAVSESTIKKLMVQICDGLEHIHNLTPPVIHRDIKLSNIMVTDDKHIKIIDFNTSRQYKENDSKDTVIMGTAGYAAPEQFGFAQTDCRSDIYALGILMNYLLTQKHPKDQLHEGKYRRIIEKCINMSPERRFSNALELKKSIQRTSGTMNHDKINRFQIIIPGFRSRSIWKMIVAFLGYLMIISIALGVESTNVTPFANVFNKFVFLFMMLTLVMLYTNHLDIKRHLPLLNHSKIVVRVSGYVIFSFLIVLIYLLIAAIVSSI